MENLKVLRNLLIYKLFLLTDKIKCLLEILFDILMRCITGWYLFVLEAGMGLRIWLAGNIQHTIGTNARWIDRIASIPQQQEWKYCGCWMCFNIY